MLHSFICFFCLSFAGRQIPVKVLFKRVNYGRKTQIRRKMKVGRQHFLQCFFLLSSSFIKAADSYLQDKMFKSIIVSVCVYLYCVCSQVDIAVSSYVDLFEGALS